MRLYFFRHAIAHDATANMTDAERELTAEGVENTRRAARALKALNIKPDYLYTSPLTRAYQTADIIAQTLNLDIMVRKEVGPGFGILAVEALTRDFGDADVMFVGHEPDFSTTISSLVGGRVVVKRGGLARVDLVMRQPMLGELVWLIAPKIFETMG